jgi:hypothetical protein
MNQVPLNIQRLLLPFKCVLLTALDENNRELPGATSSGFIRAESDGNYLYTCWHVVTGFNPHDLRVMRPPRRKFLKISMQGSNAEPNMLTLGGRRSFTIPLYDGNQSPAKPLWLQDGDHVYHADLNAIDIHVPFWHDIVKIKLPEVFSVPDAQRVTDVSLLTTMEAVDITEKVLIVGFPYGYSALGPTQPTPIVLTRFVAAKAIHGRRRELLLESPGAPGMSGAPMFVERYGQLLLFGAYTGLIYPDHVVDANEKTTALGTVVDLTLLLRNQMQLTNAPLRALTSDGHPHVEGGSGCR